MQEKLMENVGAGFQITLDLFGCECDISLLKDYIKIKEDIILIIKKSLLTPVADVFYSFSTPPIFQTSVYRFLELPF